MTLQTRRIIYLSFIAAFFIAAPLLLLYTSGYRYNPKKQKVQSRGALVLRVEPRDADTYVNNELQPEPALFENEIRLPDLVPGEYNIEVKKENYFTWQKRLLVEPNKTTYALNIQLFKQSLPLSLFSSQEKIYSWPPGEEKILTSDKNFNLLDLSKDDFLEGKLSLSATLIEPEITWSNGQEKIIFQEKNKIILWETITQNEKDLSSSFAKFIGFKNLQWPEDNTDSLYFIYQNSLWRMSTFTLEPKLILVDFPVDSYLMDEKFIYSVENKNEEETIVKIYPLGELENPSFLTLPYSPEYKLFTRQANLIPILDQKNQILYIYDEKNPERAQTIVPGVKNFVFSENKERLLYYNDFEIWTLHLSQDKKNLLTRISQEIKNVLWYPKEHYIIYALDNAIYTLEIDDRDKKNLTELVSSVSSIQNLKLIDDKLYFQAILSENKNLFELGLE